MATQPFAWSRLAAVEEDPHAFRDVQMDDVTVAVTRKALALIRKRWHACSPLQPFYSTQTLQDADLPSVSFGTFAYRFTQAHAMKRHRKGVNTK
jgi:hypothetical protein